MKRIGVLTGGGDCPGTNNLIRGIVVKAAERGVDVYGFRRGWEGLMDGGDYIPLRIEDVGDIALQSGTILRTSRANPIARKDGPRQISENLKRQECEALIVIGGYDILNASNKLYTKHKIPIVAIPKSVKNNVAGTDYDFGFLSAVNYATEAIDRLHTTACSYGRCMVVEITGQKVGWSALYAGLPSGAHKIIIPEFPYDLGEVCKLVRARKKAGEEYTLIVIAEGARPGNQKGFHVKKEKDEFGNEILQGTGQWLADQIQKKTRIPTQCVVLSSILRVGTPTIFDRMLGIRFGARAVELALKKQFGTMVSVKSTEIEVVPLSKCVSKPRKVPAGVFKNLSQFVL